MSTFQADYTDEQRDALAEAYEDRGIRPAHRVAALAEAGELKEGLAAFKVKGGANTVRDMARRRRNQRAGRITSELAQMPPRDAIEALRRRLVNAVDAHLAESE